MSKFGSDNKRNEQRTDVDIILNKYIKGRPYLCRASNISRQGMLIHRVNEPHSEETHIGLQFLLPGQDRVITCAGEIVHEHNWLQANGVRFTCVAPEHQVLIDRFLLSNAAC